MVSLVSGNFLYKCNYCMFYHWQKRTAEKHIVEKHPGKSVLVKNVREEYEIRERMKNSGGGGMMKKVTNKRKEKDCPPCCPGFDLVNQFKFS